MRSNLLLLERIARQARPLLGELVFVGGATTELFFTSPAAARVRITRDADAICEVTGRIEYHHLGERLRDLGFREDLSPGAPVCRWRSESGILDVMPTDERILGFSNPWYLYGIRSAHPIRLARNLVIRVVSPPVFLATKLAAFAGRGGGDLVGSHDIEDIVSVVAFRPELVSETAAEGDSLRRWIADRVRELFVDHPDAEDSIAGNLPDARVVADLIPRTQARFRELARASLADR
jgi:hypothetical protein